MKRDATSVRQSAKWGVMTIKSLYPQLQHCSMYKENEEKRIIMKNYHSKV